MRLLRVFIFLCAVGGLMSGLPVRPANAQIDSAADSEVGRRVQEKPQQVTEQGGRAPKAHPSFDPTRSTLWQALGRDYVLSISIGLVVLLFGVGMGVAFYRCAIRHSEKPRIDKLDASFFFWLGISYMAILLLLAVAYYFMPNKRVGMHLLGGILPIGVPWFGALGAVTISLQGVFDPKIEWDSRYNYWHMGRPIFGAVLGLVSFFLFVLIVTASGSPPEFLTKPPGKPTDLIVFYMVAFLAGYREQTFRELIKRATDLILRPAETATASPAVTFKAAGGGTVSNLSLAATAASPTSFQKIEIHNTGNASLVAPAVAVTVESPTPTDTFGKANDQVTASGDLAPGQCRTVEVVFTSQGPGSFAGTLTVTAANLATPRTIPILGTRT
jgi:hypothetical protein